MPDMKPTQILPLSSKDVLAAESVAEALSGEWGENCMFIVPLGVRTPQGLALGGVLMLSMNVPCYIQIVLEKVATGNLIFKRSAFQAYLQIKGTGSQVRSLPTVTRAEPGLALFAALAEAATDTEFLKLKQS